MMACLIQHDGFCLFVGARFILRIRRIVPNLLALTPNLSFNLHKRFDLLSVGFLVHPDEIGIHSEPDLPACEH
jgi:hypothetical protein